MYLALHDTKCMTSPFPSWQNHSTPRQIQRVWPLHFLVFSIFEASENSISFTAFDIPKYLSDAFTKLKQILLPIFSKPCLHVNVVMSRHSGASSTNASFALMVVAAHSSSSHEHDYYYLYYYSSSLPPAWLCLAAFLAFLNCFASPMP
jgi:hypothetical protein